jgi:hypothetical protein
MNPPKISDIILDLPELAQAQLAEARPANGNKPEHLPEPRRDASVWKVRAALLELARALYGFDHHLHTAEFPRSPECEPAQRGQDGEPEWQMACAHLLRLWVAREALELACLNAPEDTSGCKCHGTGTTPWGVCYGCRGKGWKAPEDVKRCNYYWNNIGCRAAVKEAQ